jgi:histidine kinase/DNA gyrase B/HSP90-like ATPase
LQDSAPISSNTSARFVPPQMDRRCPRRVASVSAPLLNIAEQRRIFEKFYRVALKENKAISGMRLGLTLVAIAEAHGGTVDVGSIPGKGSTFSKLIPRTRHETALLEEKRHSTAMEQRRDRTHLL